MLAFLLVSPNVAFKSAVFESQFSFSLNFNDGCRVRTVQPVHMNQICQKGEKHEQALLVASDDEPVSAWEPVVVVAESKEEAIDRYQRVEYSKDQCFRDGVLALTVNCSFLEKFFIASPSDILGFEATGKVDFDLDIVKARVRHFFGARPDIGEKFVRYMDTHDTSYVDEEVFEFISAADPSGIVAQYRRNSSAARA